MYSNVFLRLKRLTLHKMWQKDKDLVDNWILWLLVWWSSEEPTATDDVQQVNEKEEGERCSHSADTNYMLYKIDMQHNNESIPVAQTEGVGFSS